MKGLLGLAHRNCWWSSKKFGLSMKGTGFITRNLSKRDAGYAWQMAIRLYMFFKQPKSLILQYLRLTNKWELSHKNLCRRSWPLPAATSLSKSLHAWFDNMSTIVATGYMGAAGRKDIAHLLATRLRRLRAWSDKFRWRSRVCPGSISSPVLTATQDAARLVKGSLKLDI